MRHILRTFFKAYSITLALMSPMHIVANVFTPQGEWLISSPSLKDEGSTRASRGTLSFVQTLQELGEKANDEWKTKKDNQDAIEKLQTVFESVDREYLIAYIDEIVQDDARLESIAKASYRNVIGFWKIVLAASDAQDGWKIRLHVWEQQDEKEFPHNHKWDFYSKIICGYLSQDIYAKSSECDATSQHSVRQPVSLMPTLPDGKEPCPCRDHYILDPKEGVTESTVSLQRNTTHYIGAGESYFMPRHLIHSIDPSKHAISLVFTSDRVVENSEVFVPMDFVETDLSRYAPSITIDDLREKLLLVKSNCNSCN